MQVQVRVRLFASIRESLGRAHLDCVIEPGATISDLLSKLAAEHPSLATARFTTALNRGYATADRVLADGDEIALIPPVSGG